VSPVTPDHVNPEAPWPHLEALARHTRAAGRTLVERLAITPAFARRAAQFLPPAQATSVLAHSDARGHARTDGWCAGTGTAVPPQARLWLQRPHLPASARIARLLSRAVRGEELDETQIAALFGAEGEDLHHVLASADSLREEVCGPTVTFVVNRNINYTNICLYRCGFCAFSKGGSRKLRGPGYRMDLDEIARRVVEAHARGATEVCLQGGIHPEYSGNTYLDIVAAVKGAVPSMHLHAFSPLEVTHGARTLGVSLASFLERLKAAGLSTLPGTAAEILDDEIRAIICPDKLDTAAWLEVMQTAHAIGLRSTATIMFGHVEQPVHWARHLLRLRALQQRTGGFTEFVPLPFVHMEAPLARRGLARPGPTLREALLMHAVGRLVLHPHVRAIQTSWVKMGREGAALCLAAGANDLGGTLMNESITRAAGGSNGQEMTPADFAQMTETLGRPLRQRSTLYGDPAAAIAA